MKLPVLESIISGECYKKYCEYGGEPKFSCYLVDIDVLEFDLDNPFGFNCRDLFKNLQVCDTDKYVYKRVGEMINYVIQDLRSYEHVNKLHGINDELKLLCNQLYFLENDYDNYSILQTIVEETFESLLSYLQRYNENEIIKVAFRDFVFEFYIAYYSELRCWINSKRRNKRLIAELINSDLDSYYRTINNVCDKIDKMKNMMQNHIISTQLFEELEDSVVYYVKSLVKKHNNKEHNHFYIKKIDEFIDITTKFSNYVISLIFFGTELFDEGEFNNLDLYNYQIWVDKTFNEIKGILGNSIEKNGGKNAIKLLYYKWENRYFSCKKTDGSCRFEYLFDKIMKEIKMWLELPEETLYIIKTDRYSELINPTFNDVVNMRIIDNREQVGNEGIFKSEANVELDDVEQKIVLARKYLGFLDWEYDKGKRFVSKEHYESVVRDFAQLLASGVCPNNVKTIEMLNKKSYNFVTACLYNAYLVEKRNVESNRIDDEWVKFCQKLFPNKRFKRGDFSQRPSKYDEWVGKYKSTIGK